MLFAPQTDGYLAASLVDFLREELLRRGAPFTFETVMSHASKVEFFARARAVGYKTYLYFVCTNAAELNVERVRLRVGQGGHSVPEDKIRERYYRCLALVNAALKYAYRAYFFDNSEEEPIWLAEFDDVGRCNLKVKEVDLPAWFRDNVESLNKPQPIE